MDQLRATRPEVEIETIEVLTHPLSAIKNNVLMVPTIIIGNRRWHHAPALNELLQALDFVASPGDGGYPIICH